MSVLKRAIQYVNIKSQGSIMLHGETIGLAPHETSTAHALHFVARGWNDHVARMFKTAREGVPQHILDQLKKDGWIR
jgi:hypothetical protein